MKNSTKTAWIQRLIALPETLLNLDLDPGIDWLFERLERFFTFLERWIPALRLKKVNFSLGLDEFNANREKRERFLPVRLPIVVSRLVDGAASDDEREKRRLFAKVCCERFHLDFLARTQALYDAFAPFDPDAEERYEEHFTEQAKRDRAELFLAELNDALAACNFVELPKTKIAECLNLTRPGKLPLVAKFDDFDEYRFFVRGVVSKPSVRFPRWRCGGARLELESETLSRVCFVAHTGSAKGVAPEIVVKLFKNLPVEDLKLAAPRVEFKFRLADGLKLGGAFSGSIAAPIVKIILATTNAVVLATACVIALIKSFLGLLNKRTSFMRSYSETLYYNSLAANRAAISLLVAMAEEQEVKEILIGYFAARQLGDWATERQIDATAENWLKERFELDVDFESSDALRKLCEKRLLETRTPRRPQNDAEQDAPGPPEYRVVPLDRALKTLDEDWDALHSFD